ncbi:MAG: adenosyl-hopene transferase HpnH [Thermoguttaceae bacterium]
MRFPFSLTCSLTSYLARMNLRRQKRFPLVLMLEPLHACNLHCSGCGRIREYAETRNSRLSVEECLSAVDECPAPIVSVCGGEPLIYPEITQLIDGIIARGKHIYLCTNGTLLEEKLAAFDTAKNPKLKGRLYWNVHLDGPEELHDKIVEQSGVYQKAIRGIKAAKSAGYYVYTNTTVYKQTKIEQLQELAQTLTELKIDGVMLAPGYGYESVTKEEENRAESMFLTRAETHALFQEIRIKLAKYRLTATPIFMDFLCGKQHLNCAAYANPTKNIAGWRSPCYLIADKHCNTFAELMEQTNWEKIGPGNDPRCENCSSHCGFEPAAVFASNTITNMMRMAFWQFT